MVRAGWEGRDFGGRRVQARLVVLGSWVSGIVLIPAVDTDTDTVSDD